MQVFSNTWFLSTNHFLILIYFSKFFLLKHASQEKTSPLQKRIGMIPKKITFTSPLIDLCESPPAFSSLETADLVKISPLEVDASHEVSISRVLNSNFITPSVPRTIPNWPRLLFPTLNPSFSQPPRISTTVFATLGLPTDNVPTVLYSHPWSSNSNFPSFVPPANPCTCSVLSNVFSNPPILPQPLSFGYTWINPYEPRPSLGSFNHCYQVNYIINNPRIECAGYVNKYLLYLFF